MASGQDFLKSNTARQCKPTFELDTFPFETFTSETPTGDNNGRTTDITSANSGYM